MRGSGPYLDWTARARAVPIVDEIRRRGINNLKRVGDEYVGPCPKCGGDDRFAVHTKKNIFNCRNCSVGGDVIQLVEHLDGVDFKTACETLVGPQPKANGKDRSGQVEIVVAQFQYHDENGNTLLAVERIEFQKLDGDFALKDGKRDKTFKQKRPDPDHRGKWIHNADGVPPVPYRLPQLIEAIANGHPILIVEGEAKAELLWSWNIAATCCVGGAKKWKPEHSKFLRGADVFLLPDNDNAGWEHIHKVGASLSATAKTIRVLNLPGLPLKGDIIDWAKAGGTREQFDALLVEAPVWRLPKVDDLPDKKSAATAGEDELLNALAKMPKGVEFGRERKRLVKALGVTSADIDAEIEARRVEAETMALLEGHWYVEPWPEPVDGDALIRDIIRKLQKHVVMSYDHALAIALWTMLGWVHDEVATHSPILDITSAEPESGKSTTLGLVSFLLHRCVSTVEISEAAIYRAIELWQPSFAIDEFDSVLANDDKAGLRAVINSGHTRGQGVIKCVGDDKTPQRFKTFAPKCIGMIGRKLPPATLSRCIVIEMRRRKKDEQIERFKHVDDAELADLRSRLRRWSMDNEEALRAATATVSMPDGFENRRGDNWRIEFAIADLAGEDWGDQARAAAVKIEADSDTSTIGVRLLADIKRIFDEEGCDCMLSAVLAERLKADPEQPWAEWKRGRGLTQNSLATLLGGGGGRGRRGGYGIHSGTVHPSRETHGQGYKRAQFEDAWAWYLRPEHSPSGGE